MKLSIITCTYNSENFLRQTLDSVSSQDISSLHSIEHVILDGFSKDSTIDIAYQYKKEVEWKINVVIVQSEPKWIYNAFNEWIRNSTGEYIWILPSDDFLEPWILQWYLDFIESTGLKDLYYAKRNTFDNHLQKNVGGAYPNKSIYYKWLNHLMLGLSCYISQPTVISKRSLHDRFGFYNEKLRLVSDWEFYICLTQAHISSQFYDAVVTNFRVHEWSASTGTVNLAALSEHEEIYIFKKYYWILGYFLIFIRKIYRTLFY